MGTADAVPGVSGGTIALIAGIYERLIRAIESITPTQIKRILLALVPLNNGTSIQQAYTIAEENDIPFIISLVVGIGTALLVVTRIVHIANQERPVLLFGFFFGLIAASSLILLRAVSIRTKFQALTGFTGFLLSILVSGSATMIHSEGLLIVFLAGSIASSAMILPGISGSLLLLILGQYTRMSTALTEFVNAVLSFATGGSFNRIASTATEVFTFVIGGLLGVVSISRVVRRALDSNRPATLSFLVAMVVGALRAPVQRVHESLGFSKHVLISFAIAAATGAVLLLALEKLAVDIESV